MSQQISNFRRILPQVIAAMVKNIMTFNIGLRGAMPAILIPALTGIRNEPNRNELIFITPTQASWIASIMYIIIPIGSLFSGPITDPIGRKRALMLVNIPFFVGWFLLYRATEFQDILIGFMIMAVANGVGEAPILTFVAEISEPSIRGTLVACSAVSFIAGHILIFVLNTLMPWRSIAMICSIVPVIAMIAISFVPETPQWLLSKNRVKDAEKSLCWLRGWVEIESVTEELHRLKQHSERSKSCDSCIKQETKCSHPLPTLRDKLSTLKQKSTLKPFAILMVLFALLHFSGYSSMRPYIVNIFKAYESPIPVEIAALALSIVDSIGQIIYMFVVRFVAKRRLYLPLGSAIVVICFILSCYGFIMLPSGYNSFDHSNQSFHLENPNLAYIPIVCLFLWSFLAHCGFSNATWIFLAELLPFKSRAIMSGICAAINCSFAFVGKKTYYDLERTLSLPGIVLFYSLFTATGLILIYFILPDTEGRTLEEIELHFSDDSKKLTDRKIAKLNWPGKLAETGDVENPEKESLLNIVSNDKPSQPTH